MIPLHLKLKFIKTRARTKEVSKIIKLIAYLKFHSKDKLLKQLNIVTYDNQ